jgi:hypothetical protein
MDGSEASSRSKFYVTPDDAAELFGLLQDNETVTLDAGRTYTINRTVRVPANRVLNLNGATLHHAGIETGTHHGFHMLELTGDNVEIYGGTFTGNHTSGWTNAQMAAIACKANTSLQNIDIHDCRFENLVGFVFWGLVYGTGLLFLRNTIINCGNGVNFAFHDAIATDNLFIDAEGFETIGNNLYVARNTFNNAFVTALGIGGDVGSGISTGVVVEDNVINGVAGGGVGIITADGLQDAILRRNKVYDAPVGFSSQVSVGFSSETHGVLWQDNEAHRCGIGYYFPNFGDRLTGIEVTRGVVRESDDYGILIGTPHIAVSVSDFTGNPNANVDVLLQASSAGCTFVTEGEDANLYDTILDQRP